MAWSRKSKPKAQRVVRRVKQDGTVAEYRYAAYKPKARPVGDTVEALVDAYQSSPEWHALSKQTQAGRGGYLKPLVAIGSVRVTDVKRRDIISIHDTMKVEIGNGSANGFLAAAKALFAWGIEKEWLEHPPTLKIKSAPGGHLRAWTRQEADAAERGLSEPLRRLVVLARHTGQRRGDLCAMTWTQYDGSSLRVTQQKSKPGAEPVKLVIPVTPTLRAELDAWRVNASAVTILTNRYGQPFKPQSLSHVLPLALGRIGLSAELNVHGLRKLAAAELANAGCSAHEVMSITGHKTLSMVQLYTASADQERLATAAVIRLGTVTKINRT